MGLTQNSVVVYNDQITGIDERYTSLEVYIDPDTVSERNCYVPKGYLSYYTAKLIQSRYMFSTFTTRYIGMHYQEIPVSDRYIGMLSALKECSERYCYTYLDTSWKWCYCEGKVENTPLLMKYPKYYNNEFLPLVITPAFKVWGFYPLDLNTLTVLVKDITNNREFLYNYAVNREVFEVEETPATNGRGFIYSITVKSPDLVFPPNTQIEIYIDVYDIYGNQIKKLF